MKFVPKGPKRYVHQRRILRRIIETKGVCALLCEPGTGKTAPTLDYLSILALKSPTVVGGDREIRALVISPKAAVDNWVIQAEKYVHDGVNVWAEALGGSIVQKAETMRSRGPEVYRPRRVARKKDAAQLPHRGLNADRAELLYARGSEGPVHGPADLTGKPRLILLSMNYDTFASRASRGSTTMADVLMEAVKRFKPDVIVCDEMHKLKGPGSNTSRLIARVGSLSRRRIGLTGTVMPHALTLDSPILTPSGWKPMREMQVGDQVIGADGQTTEVVGVWPQGERRIFTVTFSDGSTVDCTEDHLWTVTSRGRRSRGLPPLTIPTGDLSKGRSRSRVTSQEVGLFDKGGAARWAIPTVDPVDFPNRPVPIDPYLMGLLLLGDGHFGHPVDFTTADEEIVKYAEAALPSGLQLTITPGQNGSRASRYRITSGKKGGSLPGAKRGPAPNAVAVALDELGLRGLRGPDKFVPEVYLWNDRETRLGVLRGLMDADGTSSVGSTSKFVTTSPRLAEGVKHLVRSLGGYVSERVEQKSPQVMPQGHSSEALPQHVLLFGMDLNPFRLSRKADAWRRRRTESKLRTIVAVEPKGTAPAQCITVNAEDGLFITKDFVVTHNSPMDVFAQWRFVQPTAFGAYDPRTNRRKRATFGEFQRRFGVMGGFMGREVVRYINLDEMQAIMADNSIVVKKEDALDLPQAVDVVIPVVLSAKEQRIYAEMKSDLAVTLGDTQGQSSVPNRLTQMLRLRQITAGHLPNDSGEVQSIGDSKVSTIASIAHDTLEGENRIVVFAVFRHEIEELRRVLSRSGTEVQVIDGNTSDQERLRIRKRFGDTEKYPERIILVAQIKTISLSVNELVTANNAIFASLSQQRDDLIQARDRLNRIGQKRKMTFWFPLARGTVDEVIYRSHEDRTNLEAAVLKHVQGITELPEAEFTA